MSRPWPMSVVALSTVKRPSSSTMRASERLGVCMPFMTAQRPLPRAPGAPADALGDALEALRDVEVVHRLAGREAVAVAQHVAQPQLERIGAELLGQQVDALLRGPHRLRRRIAAEGARGRRVRVHAARVDLDVVEAVGADRRPAALGGDVRAGVGVGAGVPVGPHAPRDERAVAARAEAHAEARGMAHERHEDLVAREHDAHREPGLARERGGDRLDPRERLGAEAAAHRRRDDAHVALVEPERPGELAADVERRLRARPDRQAPVAPLGERGVRLERRVRGAGALPLALDDDLGLVEAGLAAAVHEAERCAGRCRRAGRRPVQAALGARSSSTSCSCGAPSASAASSVVASGSGS